LHLFITTFVVKFRELLKLFSQRDVSGIKINWFQLKADEPLAQKIATVAFYFIIAVLGGRVKSHAIRY